MSKLPLPERIQQHIMLIRGEKVMLDVHLALLYDVETRALIQAVKRNIDRFPDDFMFQLTNAEFDGLKSQNVISSYWGGRRYTPYAFTEQGVAMLSSVLRSNRAVHVNIEIMRAFVQLRQLMDSHKELKVEIKKLERKCDKQFKVVFEVIRQLMTPPKSKNKRTIGFAKWENK